MACVKIQALNLIVSFTKTISIGPNISKLNYAIFKITGINIKIIQSDIFQPFCQSIS